MTIQPRRLLFLAASTLAITGTLALPTGCKPKDAASSATTSSPAEKKVAPLPFTAKLTEIEGVQAVYTVRHPKLVLEDLSKLMAEIPEAAMAGMFLMQLAPYGYPEFPEIAAGSNIGIALLELTPEEIAAGKPAFVAFAQLKDGGKLATLLKKQGFALEKRDAWTWIAKNPADFARVKNPAALAAHLSQPQTDELRLWGRLSPELLSLAKSKILPQLEAGLAARPPAEQKAIVGYFNVAWGYVEQLHSLGGALDLGDTGLTLATSAQFHPDSATGTYLRYAPGATPAIATSIPSDALMSAIARQSIPGTIEFINGLADALLTVDYPPVSESLKKLKPIFARSLAQSDGGVVMTFDMSLPKGDAAPEVNFFGVQTGSFTEADVLAMYKETTAVSETLTKAFLAALAAANPAAPRTEMTQQLTENALTIDGIRFGAQTTTQKTGDQTITTTQYFGVAGGNLVYGTNEAALRAKLPAILAKTPVANPVALTFSNDEILVGAIHGEKIVDAAATAAELNLADAALSAQLAEFKQAYAAAGPVKLVVNAGQARATTSLSIPYKFIAQSVALGQFVSASKAAPETATP